MVFHLFERFFGTYGDPKGVMKRDSTFDYLVQNGFSEEEAKNLTWLNSKQNTGKYWGTIAGFWTVWISRPYFATLQGVYPRFRHQRYWVHAARLAIVVTGYLIGDYFGTSSLRKGGNDQLSSIWKNNLFIFTREKFGQEYEVMNRRFTNEEISQFYANEMKKTKARNWNYNPEIHGDKEEWERSLKLLQSGDIVKDPRVQQKIFEDNQAKLAEGEKVQEKPWDLNTAIDRRGIMQEVDKLPWFTGWRALF